jgi:tRNA dimethylallyltransferase
LRRDVTFHCIDVVDPCDEYSTGRYVRDALRCAAEIHERGRAALFAGGTPLYLRALVRGFCPAPRGDPAERARMEERIAAEGLGALYEDLRRVDPEAAAKIHPNDKRRITRELEVQRASGVPFTELWKRSELRLPPGGFRILGIQWPREELYRRIDARVDRMAAAGLFEEARAVAARYPARSRTAWQCIGYREIWEAMERNEEDAAVIELIKRNTRHFARKQLTWFRGFPEIEWIAAEGKSAADAAAEALRRLDACAGFRPTHVER